MDAYVARVFDRAVRTALQVLAGYLVAAHTIGGVDWRTALLAMLLSVAVSLLQGLVDLPTVTVLGVWGEIAGRALRTFAQTALGSVGAAALISDVPWGTVLGASALAALSSLVTSAVAMPMGPDAVKGTPELFSGSRPAPGPAVATS